MYRVDEGMVQRKAPGGLECSKFTTDRSKEAAMGRICFLALLTAFSRNVTATLTVALGTAPAQVPVFLMKDITSA